MDLTTLALLSAGAFAGSLVQAATGFGFAIVAAPVFLAVLSSHAALQVLVVIHLVQTIYMMPTLWPSVPRPLLRALALGALVGSPLGLFAFLNMSVTQLKLAVGVLILAATLLLALREAGLLTRWLGSASAVVDADVRPGLLAQAAGMAAGAMTALLVMPGPPLMLYLAGRPLPPLVARALAIAFFGLCYVVVTALNVVWGDLSWPVWKLAALLAPAVLIGTIAGQRLASRVTAGGYRIAILTLLVLSGLGAVVSAL